MKRTAILLVLLVVATTVVFAGSQSKMWWLHGLPVDGNLYLDDNRYIAGDSTNYEIDVSTGLNVDGAVIKKVETISSSTTLTATSADWQIFDATAGTYTVTLPSTATVQGKVFYFKDITSANHVLYLDPAGSQTIDGATHNNEVDAQYDCLGIVSVAGEGWVIIERRIQ